MALERRYISSPLTHYFLESHLRLKVSLFLTWLWRIMKPKWQKFLINPQRLFLTYFKPIIISVTISSKLWFWFYVFWCICFIFIQWLLVNCYTGFLPLDKRTHGLKEARTSSAHKRSTAATCDLLSMFYLGNTLVAVIKKVLICGRTLVHNHS